jgi:predicted nucleotidyltransferase component of viral defense system
MHYNDKALREVFHFLFLENLLRVSDPHLYVLKGGVNLRFFFKSPRYSEDMDIDVNGGSVTTLKKNGYKILESHSFRRVLLTYGIADLKINDPLKAKQTETTQRFRLRLINQVGEEFPTKVEFSRRTRQEFSIEENIDPEISRQYKRLSFRCQHFEGKIASEQKIRALAGRPITQARDVFDLYILYLGGHFNKDSIQIESEILDQARVNAISISYEQYRDQVEEYLNQNGKLQYSGSARWNEIQSCILEQIS